MSQEIADKVRSIPKPQIFGFAKIGREANLQQLRQGRLYCRRHSYYREIEAGKPLAAHQDVNDGIGAVFQPEGITIQFGDVVISGTADLVGGTVASYDYENPIFCLHAIYAGGNWTASEEADELKGLEDALRIPSKMDEFGSHIWVIAKRGEFFRRLHAACDAQSIHLEHTFVRYVDADQVHGVLPEKMQPFVKLRDFEQEREYRILLGSKEGLPDPFILDVGPLDDITHVLPLAEVRAQWSIRKRS